MSQHGADNEKVKVGAKKYEPVVFGDIAGYEQRQGEDLFKKLKFDLDFLLKEIGPKDDDKEGDDAQFETVLVARKILNYIDKLDKSMKKEADKQAMYDLVNQVLYRTTYAIYALKTDFDQELREENIAQLGLLCYQLNGSTNDAYKYLGGLLYGFAAAAVIAGILMAIPLDGGNVLFSALALSNLNMVATFIGGLTLQGANALAAAGLVVSSSALGATAIGGAGVVVGAMNYAAGFFQHKRFAGAVAQLPKVGKKETTVAKDDEGSSDLAIRIGSAEDDYPEHKWPGFK